MSEIHNDNPETKSPSSEVSQPEPAKASESDKDKLTPQENDAGKANRENSEKNETGEKGEHPKLEANGQENHVQPEAGKQPQEGNEHGKLMPEQPKTEQPKTEEPKVEQPKTKILPVEWTRKFSTNLKSGQ